MRDKEQKNSDKELIKILRKYLQTSNESFKDHENVRNYKRYYYGDNRAKVAPFVGNTANLIKPIIDTKRTLILDNNITTSIIPKNISFANFAQIQSMKDIADILDDCKSNVFDNNQIDVIKKEIVKSALIANNGIAEVYWDQELNDGVGDVVISYVNMEDVFPDPNSKSLETADYVFVRKKASLMSLKKKYPDFSDELDDLAAKTIKRDNSEGTDKQIITTKTDQSTQQKYYGNNTSIQNLTKTIDVYSLYCKDDTIFIPEKNDQDVEEKEAQMAKQELMYPEGRCIVFCGDDIILEDKEMENPLINFENESGDLLFQPISLVKDLLFLQERINNAYYKLRDFMRKTLSILALDGAGGITPGDLINQDAILLNPYAMRDGLIPHVIENNTISAMNEVIQYIQILKQQIYEVARINPMMISGEKASGVTSGEQVAALNESPMTSIRESQKQFANFMVRLTEKVIKLIQKNYTLGRIVKLSTSDEQYAQIPLKEDGQNPDITIFNEAMEAVKVIKGSLDIGDYKVKIIAGTEMPMSKTMYSNTTMQLVNLGVFDDPRTSLESKKLILESLDYPNRREIIKKLEEKDQELKNAPPPEPPVDKIGLSFKDLIGFPDAQANILKKNGLIDENAQLAPIPPMEPIPQQAQAPIMA